MYTVSTDTGLADTPIDVECANGRSHRPCGQRPISYRVARDGTPQYDGWIDVHKTHHVSAKVLRGSVQELVIVLTVQVAYYVHPPTHRIVATCGGN